MPQFLGLRFVLVDGKTLVHVKVPDCFSGLSRIESLILRVTDPAKFRIGRRRFGPVTLTDELDDAFALVDLVAQHLAQIAALGAEDVLPDWFVAEKGQCVRDKLAGAAQFLADSRNENGGTRRHNGMISQRAAWLQGFSRADAFSRSGLRKK